MKGLLQRFLAKRRERADMAALIARRAVRVSNRKASTAARYEAVHQALAQGRKA